MGARGLIETGVPPQPQWILYVKAAIIFLATIVFALGAYGCSLGYLASGGVAGMDIFIAIWTYIVYGGTLAVEHYRPDMFYRIVALIGYILATIFWLSAWAWSANVAALWLDLSWKGTDAHNLGGAMAGAAATGAINWVLVIVHLVFFIRGSILDPNTSGRAELGQVKPEASTTSQQPYPQQSYNSQ
ncbi:uncharacterized protein CTHT_0037710 [Thermochaetoides thermophila DSM 1495]|uniref:MARVEL domain-containing protein n=1 Tax=Chaetomium thermophilum (strain DSM 1495 / CBS 144.50 / IMI 039719) TaxID=759272 RepID=G0S864_CHATD|nr:hypothetical protein CTHT_0037710 [Thermochaetoides thermophila DSM 1495]EGS21898.1 hypothetical protein CTHT_0037710 [Thermochaetoides thermophila DSM 1495]